jgi:hypothetical protein
VWLLRSKEKKERKRPHVEAKETYSKRKKRPTVRDKRDLHYEAKET